MTTQRQRILAYLRSHPHGADDDLLARELGILERRYDRVAGKIVNRLADADMPSTTGLAATNPGRPVRISRVVMLDEEEVLQRFAYAGEVELTEDQVKQTLEEVVRREGWEVIIRWDRAHGIDIVAHRGTERLVLQRWARVLSHRVSYES